MVDNKQKIWGSLLFARTDWTDKEDIEYYLEESKKICIISLFDVGMLDLNMSTRGWLQAELEKLNIDFDMYLLNDDTIVREYGYIFQEIGTELNEILFPELFQEFNYDDKKKITTFDDEYGEKYLVHENEILINKLNEKFKNVGYGFKKFTKGTTQKKVETTDKIIFDISSYNFKFEIVPRINNIEEYIYTDLKDYLLENGIPIRCALCNKVIENPSKYQLARARRKDDIFHKPCYEKNKREKDKIRKQELRKKK